MPSPKFAVEKLGLAALALSAVCVGACSGLLNPPDRAGSAGSSAGVGGGGGTHGSGSAGASGSAGTTGAGGGSTGSAGAGNAAGTGGRGGSGAGGVTGVAGTGGAGPGTAGTTGTAGGQGGSGTAGSSAAGSGGAGGSGPPRGPTPATAGVNFPFPQNRQMSGCVYPTGYLNSDVMAAYAQWKTDLVTSNGAGGFRRVQRTSTDGVSMSTPAGSTVSEGIGYGMLIAVYMNDQPLFDDLWRYEQLHLDTNGLMNWSIDANGTMTPGMGGATDADEDMAFALVMADKQWGGKGSLQMNYLDYGKAQINNIWLHEVVDSKLAGPGDGWGPTNLWNFINISYFAPSYYRVFKALDSGHAWDAVIQTVYDTITASLNTTNGNSTNGLVPAWCTSTGGASSGQPFNYQYDSCRTPFRIGLDWCLSGETRAQAYVAKTSAFFGAAGAANVVDGYKLDGTPQPAHTSGQSAAFLGPAGVGAMNSASNQQFVNDAYARVATRQLLVGGNYYDESWTVLSLLMMTGNFLDYTAIQPVH